ncbi:transcriptional regulator [Haloferula helveola]|uniref:Transcriptional regulator n=1 Tax=Haloferula helveola TaxID=490095 RepID=A0ABN6H9Q0_9BACT|nr:transcriptional regulator [Haloferula helveola]
MSEAAREWLESLRPGGVRALFDTLPGLLYFAKDTEFRIMSGNRAFAQRCGFSTVSEMIGRSDLEIFPLELAEKYREDDRKVMESGEGMIGIVELFPNSIGEPEWFVTDKIPLFTRTGEVAGVCGTVRSYEGARAELQPYLDLLPATDYLKHNYAEKVSMNSLARMVGMSVRQMERRFRAAFKLSPSRYIQRLRILKACDLLVSSNLQVTEIALELGFYDHSAFSKKFSELMGMSPRAYRKRHSQSRGGHEGG